jgi:hypothetical protein
MQKLDMKKSINILFFFGAMLVMACSKSSTPAPVSPTPIDPLPTDSFPNEIKPATQANCAMGAYYRKVFSSTDAWLGITGTVVLPSMVFDSTRTRPTNPLQFLDNPSVYMGGNANNQETDIGMTWEVVKDAAGNVSPDRRAFRPFLRRTGFASSGQQATYINAPAIDKYYWYPGDTINMSVRIVSNGLLQFKVESRNKRFDTTFSAHGYQLTAFASFKRVNAIDQVNNEGRPVQPSTTKVLGAQWLWTSLYRMYNTTVVETPMHSGRYTPMRCPDPRYFTIVASNAELRRGAETISIDAGR